MNDTLYHFQISVEYKAFAVFHKSLFLVRNHNGKIEIKGQILAFSGGHFDNFQSLKTHFLDFLRVVCELFRSC